MITGSENLIEWLNLNKTPYWTIYNASAAKSTDSKVMQTPQTNNYELSDSIDLFRQFCKVVGNQGRYYIVAKQDNDLTQTKKGVYQDYFEIQGGAQAHVASTQVAHTAPSLSDDQIQNLINNKVAERLEAIERERELKELRQKVKDLEPSLLESRIGSLITTVQPFLPAIMAKMGFAPASMPAIGNTTQIHSSTQTLDTMPQEQNPELEKDITQLTDDQEKLEWAVGVLLHYSDVNMLVKLADAVRKKPSLVQTVNAFL